MKLAVMQPYFFPYIGYFQLIYAADKFVFYDDVNFIKGGWINRNRILINEEPKYFSVPLNNISSYRKTCETKINHQQFNHWKTKFYKTLEQHYGKRPFYAKVLPVINEVLEKDEQNIGALAKRSVVKILNYLKIEKDIVWSSDIYGNSNLQREERILNICLEERTTEYINLIGGKSIYSKTDFQTEGVDLHFLEPVLKPYPQNSKEFIPSLSIIDVLMNNSDKEILSMLEKFKKL